MEFGLYFGAGAMVGGVAIWIYLQWQHNQSLQDECRRMEAEICEIEAISQGLTEFNMQVQAIKDNRKAKMLEWLRAGSTLQSSEAAKQLGISTRTVRNYLTELVEDGLVVQSADAGRDVFYLLAPDQESEEEEAKGSR